jgi:hypothetical protein
MAGTYITDLETELKETKSALKSQSLETAAILKSQAINAQLPTEENKEEEDGSENKSR